MPPKADPKAKGKAKAKKEKKEVEEEDPNRVPEPDRAAHDAAVLKISEAIEALQQQSKALGEKIAERSGGKDEYQAQKSAISAQLDEFSSKINALMERKAEIQKAMGDKRQESADMRQELNKMKKSIGYTNEADIDERIAQIEKQMVTESLSLKAEKDLIKEISELKKRRPQVSKAKAMEDNLSTIRVGDNLKEQLAIINDELSQYRDGKRLVMDKLNELRDGRNSKVGDLSDVFAQRDEIQKKVQAKIQERNELRDEFRQKMQEFNAYLRVKREERAAKYAEEREAKQAEWNKLKLQRAADKLDEQPYVSEMALIEQCMNFCKGLVATKDTETKEEKKEIEHGDTGGLEILSKKEDREEFYFVPTAKKKSKTKNKGGKAESGAKPIKHNAVSFKLFDSLKLDAPITTEDIPAVLEQLEGQLESYKAKVKEWEEKREEMKRKILEEGILPGSEPAAAAEAGEAGEAAAAEE